MLLHRAVVARRFGRLEFIDDAYEFPEQLAARIICQRLGERDQFDLVLAECTNRSSCSNWFLNAREKE